jgi:hypothetical protein
MFKSNRNTHPEMNFGWDETGAQSLWFRPKHLFHFHLLINEAIVKLSISVPIHKLAAN